MANLILFRDDDPISLVPGLDDATQDSPTTINITCKRENGSNYDVTGKTITGYFSDGRDGTVYKMTGTLSGSSNVITWVQSAEDVGLDGEFWVWFEVATSGSSEPSMVASWTVTAVGGGGSNLPTPYATLSRTAAQLDWANWLNDVVVESGGGGGYITNDDLAAHIGDADAHHDPVTAGDGIGVVGQQVAVDGTVVRTTRTLTAGDGLTGGGDLSADRTFAVNYGDGLTIAADVLQVSAGDGILLALGAVNVDSTVVRTDRQIIAGDGLVTGGALSSDVTLDVGTPTSVSATSANGVTADSHVHAVIASSNPGAAESLLKSTALGGLTLETLTLNGAFTGVGGSFSGALDVGQDLTVGANILFVDVSQTNVGINCAPDAQFALDVNGNLRWRGWGVGKMALQIADATMICHYDGREPFEADFSGVSTGHMGQKATAVGPEMYRPGKFGKAYQAAPATVNYIPNPVFASTTLWQVYNDDTLATYADPLFGDYCGLIGDSLGGTSYIYLSMPAATYGNSVSQNTIYTASAYVKGYGDSVGSDVRINLRELGGAQAQRDETSASVTLTDEWQRISVTLTIQETDRTAVATFAQILDNSTDGWLIDGYQVEARAFMSPLCYGDMPGHTWAGTAHASKSSRAGSYLQYSPDNVLISPEVGTLSMWVKWDDANTSGGMLWQLGDTNGEFDAYITSSNALASRVNGSSTIDDVSGLVGEWVHLAWTWSYSDDAYVVYVNGVAVSTTTYSTLATFHATAFGIGGSVPIGVNYVFNGWIDELLIADRALEAAEILAIYESNAPVFAETSTFSWSDPSTSIWVDGEGLYGRDVDGSAVIGLSTVDGKSWAGLTLDKGDFVLGRGTQYLKWDNSAGSLTIAGDGDGITNIDGGNIQTDTITATQINVSQLSAIAADLGTITAGTVTGATIRTAASGARVQMDSSGIFGTNGTTTQWEVDNTDGKLTAGGGTVTLDETGISISVSGSLYLSAESLTFENTGALQGARNSAGTGYNTIRLVTTSRVSGKSDPYIGINSDNSEGTNNAQFESFDYINFSSANLSNVESVNFVEIATTTPGSPVTGGANLYIRNNKLIAMYNDSGTNRYKYLDLSGTGVTWVHTTTAP